jgi:curved DNA-binding protein
MDFKDYYAALGVERTAGEDEIKRAYRKLARKYHPDVSKEPDAEARFKDVGEAYEVLKDPEKRAAYDEAARRWEQRGSGAGGAPPPGWDAGFEFSNADFGDAAGQDYSDFFESLFGQPLRGARQARHAHRAGGMHRGAGGAAAGGMGAFPGEDHHAKIAIDLEDAYRGAQRTLTLRMPVTDSEGHVQMQQRQVEVGIPKGIRPGQHLRLAGQGGAGFNGGPAGDLYLEVEFNPHPLYRLDGRDVLLDLPVAPWEAALGASVVAPTPDGSVELQVPAGSKAGRRLRLRGKGLPGATPGDFYVVLAIALPPADTDAARDAYRALQQAAPGFDPRAAMEARR